MASSQVDAQGLAFWRQHDTRRPRPAVVNPGKLGDRASVPSDAIVLFDGTNLDAWQGPEGSPTKWKVENGAMMPTPNAGMIYTRRPFGDVQLHVEWQAPSPPRGNGQGRGNSGIYFMGKYEVQVLDSYDNDTYPDGQAASVYGQAPPLVNACLPPGEWQIYDIVFRAPRFNRDGSVRTPTLLTVFHNGVLVQDNFAMRGPTMWLQTFPYQPHEAQLPLGLQDHGDPVRFRNIWVRELADRPGTSPATPEKKPADADDASAPPTSAGDLDRFVGKYQLQSGMTLELRRKGEELELVAFDQVFGLRAIGPGRFEAIPTDISVVLSEKADTIEFDLMGELQKGKRLP